MTDVFAKRRFRLRAMKKLMDNYLPADQLIACPKCLRDVPIAQKEENLSVCPYCGYHWPIGAKRRLELLMDAGRYRELNADLCAGDPLGFPGYPEKLQKAREAAGMNEAVLTAAGMIDGRRCVACVLDGRFMMGSMGAAVGEKLTLAIEYAQRNRLPLIIFSASGGARMQEGILSLMQMAKTSAALRRFSEKGLLYISVLTDPTTGGVTASFAMEADIILAEPGATVGFAGARVIEQTTRKTLPKGFQKSEFVLEHGFIDGIVARSQQKKRLTELQKLHNGGEYLESSSL